jgi:hypothetical protein
MKKFLFWSILIMVLITGTIVYWKFFYTYSEGNRSGMLQKFSYKGTIFKTYEGEMILSSVESNKDVTLASEKFYFSVADDKVAAKMNEFQGHFIVVHYREMNGSLFWRGDTPYIVDSVRLAQWLP